MRHYLGMERELLIVDSERPEGAVAVLPGTRITALAVDPTEPERVFCGTSGEGLLRSVDAGNTWARVGEEIISSDSVFSVAISPTMPGVVFAGTQPSALYRSDNGGDTWREMATLQDIPSKPDWSFPPKPETHHVRWIAPHPTQPEQLTVAIEAGALVRSGDGGESWQDRVEGGPFDSHTVVIHQDRPDRIISAAGDGFFESPDRGQSWHQPETSLPYRYCYGLAVDTADPDLVVMSVAPNAGRGHGRRDRAQASIVRRHGDGSWEVINDGLPEPDGTTLSVLAADPANSGVFFAINNTGLYRSEDGARSWQRLDVPWKDEYRARRPPAIAVAPDTSVV